MDGIDIGDLGGRDYAFRPEIGFTAGGGTDADRAVGQLHVKGLDVGFRVDGDGLDVEFPAGADDAEGNLPAVGYEDFLEHLV